MNFFESEDHGTGAPYRCPNDFALLRLLEDLLPSPEQRLRTLEQIHDAQAVAVPNLVVPDSLLTKYGFSNERGSSARGRRTAAPRCVVCSIPTTVNNRLTTLTGDVVHYECRAGADDIVGSAVRFLRTPPGRTF